VLTPNTPNSTFMRSHAHALAPGTYVIAATRMARPNRRMLQLALISAFGWGFLLRGAALRFVVVLRFVCAIFPVFPLFPR